MIITGKKPDNKYSNTDLNIVTYLVAIFIFSVSYSFIDGMIGYTFMFLVLEFSVILARNYRSALRYLSNYIILLFICNLFAFMIKKGCINYFILFLGGGFYSGLKIVPLIILLIEMTHIPTSNIIGGLKKIKLPAQIIFIFVLMIRFFPTIKEEYRKIRISQKFRNVGLNIVEVLKHPFLSLEYTVVPLIIRMTKISEELALSLRVRGLRFNTKSSSLRDLAMTKKDYASLLVSLTGLVVVILVKTKFGEIS